MEFDEVVRVRRSIRKFSARDVPRRIIEELIGAALQAPSSMNGQPWHFVVVRNLQTKARLADIKNRYCPIEKREYKADFLRDAPVVVVICVERSRAFDRGIESAVLATGHLLLAAADRGIGSVYLSAYKGDTPELAADIRQVLDIPSTVDPMTIVPLGYPAEDPEPKELKGIEEVVSYEAFGKK